MATSHGCQSVECAGLWLPSCVCKSNYDISILDDLLISSPRVPRQYYYYYDKYSTSTDQAKLAWPTGQHMITFLHVYRAGLVGRFLSMLDG